MNRMTTGLILFALAGSTGCATQHGVEIAKETRRAYETFIGQPRTFCPVQITGVSSLQLTGEHMTLTMEAPLNPLHAMPQENDTLPRVVDSLKNAALGAAGIYTLGQVASQAPTVVTQPAPLVVTPEVVRPEIITTAAP